MSQQRRYVEHTITWTLATIGPLAASALAWLYLDLTTSRQQCATGSGSGLLAVIPLAALWLAPALAIAKRDERVGTATGASMLTLLLGLILLWLTYWMWWPGHDCIT